MQAEQTTVFVVVDPNDEKHVALERALIIAKLRNPQPKLVIFVAVDGEAVDTRAVNDHLFRDETWFREKIRQPAEDAGVEHELLVCWSSDWQGSIIQESKRYNAEMIYLPLHPKTNRRWTFAESKWEVLKKAKCPVVLIRPGAKDSRQVVLATVNYQAQTSQQRQLNRQITERANYITSCYEGAELHLVNAYLDSMLYPDRGALAKLADKTGVPTSRIHVRQGYTNEVVAQVAKEIDADLVVMGTLNQYGATGSLLRGNTAERVIASLDTDVMVCNEFTTTTK
ncbi:universal stress protein [Microbulbifer thermotolerans]|uniref:Universal stress protein n=1 Tax=Microbulbifer thermotolerans TaxID=252514 RepID=A0A143HQC0_MICTH|nr:universal stress protein [Microbulbifer thermotolerans]AMX03482.1 universal stress protein [Microbulbifer thermotolerans]MCX2780631.1 universal stress protein [Microbulbifer thermotolerans]MCX2783708.1 universal stress protein [Microbulbifer thermotolerans]MCX2795370.1 universal stress protein [Microbulbifer thermotolerans]MCX2802442.1 universal stress protein [Microbulbifer thermotolerans]